MHSEYSRNSGEKKIKKIKPEGKNSVNVFKNHLINQRANRLTIY